MDNKPPGFLNHSFGKSVVEALRTTPINAKDFDIPDNLNTLIEYYANCVREDERRKVAEECAKVCESDAEAAMDDPDPEGASALIGAAAAIRAKFGIKP